jgi:DNA-directed RNA polymerase specialized sigma24 family protein
MKARLGDPALRREIEAAVRRRIHGDEAEDVVQATLADALSSPQVPQDPEEFRRFVFGIARNKVFDHFRRQKRRGEDLDAEAQAGPEPPLSARDILRWAEGELPDSEAKNTLEWMLREGDGEKLEHIARDARVPAPRVRKRVSRLRKLLRERWRAELLLAGLAVLLAVGGALYWQARRLGRDDVVKPEPRVLPSVPRSIPSSRPAGDTAPSATPSVGPAPSVSPSAAPLPSAAPTSVAPQRTHTKVPPRRSFGEVDKGSPQQQQQQRSNLSDLDALDAKSKK